MNKAIYNRVYFDNNLAIENFTVVFITVPWFVDIRNVLSNIGTTYTSSSSNVANMISPISPYVAQYNPINTDVSQKLKVTSLQNALPAGVYNAASTTTSANNGVGLKRNWYGYVKLTLPKALVVSSSFGGMDSYIGSQFFIKVPSSDSLYDIVFFVYYVEYGYTAYAIQLTAGIILEDSAGQGTSKWEISSWGHKNGFPEVVDFNNGRLWFAKTKRLSNVYWVYGIHPKSLTDIQLFHIRGLLQDRSNDGNTDKSGFGFPESTSGNTDAYGHWNHSPNMSKINAISARRRVHILTERGECQVSLSNGVYLPSTADPIEVRTNSCLPYDIAKGDGKIFYISEEGIRAISTEDADYESQDSLLTASLTGLDFKFKKIVWSEKHSCLFALTENNKLFAVSHHEDTKITAVTHIKSDLESSVSLSGQQAYDEHKNSNVRFGSYPSIPCNSIEGSVEFSDISCGLSTVIIRTTRKIQFEFDSGIKRYNVSRSTFCLEGLVPKNNELVDRYTQVQIDALYPSMVGLLFPRHFKIFNNNNFGYNQSIKFSDGKFIVTDEYSLRYLYYLIGMYSIMSPIKVVRADGVSTVWHTPVVEYIPFESTNEYYVPLDSKGSIS